MAQGVKGNGAGDRVGGIGDRVDLQSSMTNFVRTETVEDCVFFYKTLAEALRDIESMVDSSLQDEYTLTGKRVLSYININPKTKRIYSGIVDGNYVYLCKNEMSFTLSVAGKSQFQKEEEITALLKKEALVLFLKLSVNQDSFIPVVDLANRYFEFIE